MTITVTQLGPYRLGFKLGQGGMGAVYAGHDLESGEQAAIKILSPALASEEGFRTRFEAEIESLKKLRHPNIVRLYGYGEQDGYLYYAMELVDGTSLEEEIRLGRRFNWREVTRLAVALCRALKHAHDHGIIHRDIKPANLLLNSAGEIKLSDFGIARLFGNSRVTSQGGVLGTAEYMAPEQADGRPVTDRCDQYSLGGVMYALLAGRPPFRAGSLVEMLQLQRFAEPQPVRLYAPDTPAELERIILQMLSKDPQKRFSNALLLARALEAMELGLARAAVNDEAAVSRPVPSAAGPADPTAITLAPDATGLAGQASPDEYTIAADGPERTAATIAVATEPGHVSAAIAAPAPAPVAAPPPRHFTKVEEAEEEPAAWYEDFWQSLGSPQLLAPLVGLLVLLTLGWYLLLPPSADKLYSRIERLAGTGSVEDLRDAEKPIQEFLTRFPEDPRSSEITAYREQLELAQMERQFDHEARRLGQSDRLTPLERAYLESVQLAKTSPERGLARFRSLVSVCDSMPQPDESARHILELSRRQVTRLEQPVAQNNKADREWAQAELDRAGKLAAGDPAAARKIWEAIVELYSDKPSMADLVQQARVALGERLGSRE